ncbi:MAG: acetylxylan esterase [Lentisphaeria bacterium]|nr:acetylxylan esterase [Lentisphaeria bacterium]
MKKEDENKNMASLTEFAAVALPAGFQEETFFLRSSSGDGIVKIGEKVTFTLSGTIPPSIRYFLLCKYVNGMKKSEKIVPVEDFPPVVMRGKGPGSLVVTISKLDENKKPFTGGLPVGDGVLVEPSKLVPARPLPADFREFWQKNLSLLAHVPMDAERKKVPLSPEEGRGLLCEDVKIKSLGELPVTGYLVMPENAAEKSLPAIVCYHGAGYKSSMKQFSFGRNAIVLDANAHGLENGREKEYYLELNKLPNCVMQNRTSLKNSYVKYMFLRTVRALDFVKSLPQWDGKNLIVFGRSQGGSQSLAAAALCKEVSLCVSNVPALGDHAGKTVKRRPGWPILNGRAGERIRKVSDYVDVVNLASLVNAPTFLSAGLMDLICPASSIALMKNQMKKGVCKELRLFPCMGHHAPGNMDKSDMIQRLCADSVKKKLSRRK